MFTVALLMGSLAALAALATGRVYDRCELARDLQLLGVDREHIATWVCIAYHESRYDTAAQNYGSGDHGLLQISELYWCGPGKACGAPCSAFRDEDISDDVKCALRIHREHTRLQGDGFLAWVVYPHHCKQNAKKYIIDCDKNTKSTPFKSDDRARHLKTDIRYESKPKVVNNPYRNAVTPRYLSINSIFQGSYVDEFEKNYYENNKQSNWYTYKVDNIDDLQLPGIVSDKQRSFFMEPTSRPATVTTLDPALRGIKPPSPKKIESNQFRRRKTFSQPQFLKNRFSDDQETSKTTSVPVGQYSERSSAFSEDLSHNIFLKLSPSVISKSLSEFPLQEIKSSDLSRYHVKTPQLDESSSSAVLTFDDLAQNPFLNSLLGLNVKSRTESPFRMTDFGQYYFRGFTMTTSRPVASSRSSKQTGWFDGPEVNSNLRESSQSSQTDENTNISIADLTQNPFLSNLFRVNTAKPSTESTTKKPSFQDTRGNYRKEFSFSTAKPTTKLALSYSPEEDFTSRRERLEKLAKIPTTAQRSRARNLTDNINIENSSTERSTTASYSTRRYQTISRQRSNTNTNDYKSTTAIQPVTEKQTVSTTAKPYTNDFNWRTIQIGTTTPRITTTLRGSLNATQVNKNAIKIQKEILPQSANRTEITGETQTTRRPETVSRLTTVDRTEINSRSTSRPQTTSRLHTVSTLGTTSRPQTVKKTESTSIRQTNSSIVSTFHTTRRPQTTIRLQTTSKPLITSRQQATSKPLVTSRLLTTSKPLITSRLQTTSKPQITSRLQTTSKPLITSRLQTTSQPIITSRLLTTSKPLITSRLQTTSKPLTTTRLKTTSKPLTTSRLQTTSRPDTTNKLQVNRTEAISRPQSTSKPEMTRGSQTTMRPESTSSPSSTLRSWSSWRVREGPHNNTLTTPRPSFTWTRPNSTVTSTTRFYSTTQKPSTLSTEASKPSSTSTEVPTAKTTQSIFDLYLRPSSQAPFKPFEFTFSKLRKGISIFSDGTTKPPPVYIL